MKFSLSAIFALLVCLLWHSWFSPDIWYHLTWGRSLAATGDFLPVVQTLIAQPIPVNPYWIFQRLMFALYSWGGIHAISVFFMALWIVIAGFWFRITCAYRRPFWGSLFFLIFVLCAQLRFEPRPEIFSLFFIAIFLWVLNNARDLKRLGPVAIAALALSQVLWSNIHGYSALGPLLVGAFFVGSLVDQPRADRRMLAMIAGAFFLVTAATFANPFGEGNWIYTFDLWGAGQVMREQIVELQPLTWFMFSWPIQLLWPLWIWGMIRGVAEIFRREHTFAGIVAVAGGLLALSALRNVPVFLLMSAPLVCLLLTDLEPKVSVKWLPKVPGLIALLFLPLVVMGTFHRETLSLGNFGVDLEPSAYPIRSTEYLQRFDLKGRKIFNDSYDGGYLTFHLPDLKVYGDSYFADGDVTLEYLNANRDYDAFSRIDERHHFDFLLVNIENAEFLSKMMSAARDWRPLFAGTHHLLFARGAAFANLPFSFQSSRFYEGEDLRHWTYANAIVFWSEIALRTQNRELMDKLLFDVDSSEYVPRAMIRNALDFALKAGDPKMLRMGLKANERMFDSGWEDQDNLAELVSAARDRVGAGGQ